MKVVAVIQARMGSRRLPGKSLMEIGGIPLLRYVIERVKQAKTVGRVVLATSTAPENDPLCTLAESLGIGVYRGSEEDVLSRFREVARETGADLVVRICADNPLVDGGEIDRVVDHHIRTGSQYSFNHVPTCRNRYPDGLGAEVINADLLAALDPASLTPEDREHVTVRFRKPAAGISVGEPGAPAEILGPDIRLDIDTSDDFGRMKGFIESLPGERSPSWTAEEIVRSYRAYFGSRVIVLLGSGEDARAYCSRYQGKIAGGIPLVASPGAWWELEKRGIPCLLIQDCFDRMEIYRLGMENYRKAEQVCRAVDGALGRSPGKKDGAVGLHHLEPAMADFCQVKFLLDNLSIRANLLGKIAQRERPDLVVVVVNPEDQEPLNQNPDAYLGDECNWFPALLELGAGGCRFTTLEYHEGGKQGTGTAPLTSGQGRLRDVLTRSAILHPVLYTLRFHGFWRALRVLPSSIMNRLRRGRTLLLLGFGYDWNRMLPELSLRGYSVHPLLPEEPADGERVPVDTSWEEEARPLLLSGGVDLSPPIFSYLALRLEKTLGGIPGWVEQVRQAVGSAGPLALLSGPRQMAREQLVAGIARSHGVPVVTWQHGAYGAHRAPVMLYTEFMNSDVVLLWGSGVKETMGKDELNRFPCRMEAVGSCELQELYRNRKVKPRGGPVLYATTGYYGNELYVSYEYPVHDNELWATQKAIIDALGNRQPAVVKLHPSAKDQEQFEGFIRMRGYRNLAVAHGAEVTFTGYLERAGAVIIDLPTGTTLLQAIASGKPVFVLTKYLSFLPEALELLKKRAFCSPDIGEFTGLVAAYLEGKPLDQSPDPENTAFLERYGIGKPDGGVSERVLGVLAEPGRKAGPRSP
ncbi:MAG TPA: NTP transferase domain-containing protein [Methanomicrobiales archaeon]|nr:NTP transferase domain-containing protein [Methanomicrobiales archaeon]